MIRVRCVYHSIVILVFAVMLNACSSVWAPVDERRSQGPVPDIYLVQEGDTLFKIAWRYRLDYRKIAAWNNLASPDRILIGQRLRLTPPGREIAAPRPAVSKPVRVAATPVVKSQPNRPPKAVTKPNTAKKSKSAWRWPTKGKMVRRFNPKAVGRNGIEISGTLGQSVHAVSPGEVVYSGSGLPGYGRLVIVKHSGKVLSAYGFLGAILVNEGDKVAVGQKIAELGTSNGNRTVLHFEIRENGKPVNPLRYLSS